MTISRALAAILLVTSAGCTSLPGGDSTYAGEYFYNFEFAYLTPDGQDVRWCIKGDMSRAELPERWGTTHVVVRGTLGPEGSYGHLGVCNRVLTVTKLVQVSNMRGQ